MQLLVQYLLNWRKNAFSWGRLLGYQLLMGLIVYLHYFLKPPAWVQFTQTGFFLFYICSFSMLAGVLIEITALPLRKLSFLALFLIAGGSALLFSMKAQLPANELLQHLSLQQAWAMPMQWVMGAFFMVTAVFIIHLLMEKRPGWYGLQRIGSLKPYLLMIMLMILLMIPLLLMAAATPAFQRVYPRAGIISISRESAGPFDYLLFETAYLLDFFTIELFFRGMMITLLSRYLGNRCILPIAFFYFSIHLGKPALEAFSSFFGGAILGIIALNTRSIWAGWVVHAGIALLMELLGAML